MFQFKVSCDQVSCQGQLLLASLVSELQGWLDAVCISYMGKTERFIFISSESSLECYWYLGVCCLSCLCASAQAVQKGNCANFSGLPRSQSICLTCSCLAEDLSPIRHSVTFVFSCQRPDSEMIFQSIAPSNRDRRHWQTHKLSFWNIRGWSWITIRYFYLKSNLGLECWCGG